MKVTFEWALKGKRNSLDKEGGDIKEMLEEGLAVAKTTDPAGNDPETDVDMVTNAGRGGRRSR